MVVVVVMVVVMVVVAVVAVVDWLALDPSSWSSPVGVAGSSLFNLRGRRLMPDGGSAADLEDDLGEPNTSSSSDAGPLPSNLNTSPSEGELRCWRMSRTWSSRFRRRRLRWFRLAVAARVLLLVQEGGGGLAGPGGAAAASSTALSAIVIEDARHPPPGPFMPPTTPSATTVLPPTSSRCSLKAPAHPMLSKFNSFHDVS